VEHAVHRPGRRRSTAFRRIVDGWPDRGAWHDGAVEPHDVQFFTDPAAWRAWLAANHADEREVWVGYWRRGTGRPSMTWAESVDEALCFGWIDGVRKRIDDERYTNRFTPRRPGSTWSKVNIGRVEELSRLGLMHPAGLAAFAARDAARSGIYSFEQRRDPRLSDEQEATFRADVNAWAWFERQAPSYRRTAIWWVISAKRADTQARRLATLIADSGHGRRIAPLAPRPK
jgi:uncharacterized protein YdeI (YjbR/CyaY-like superfamily)